MGKQPILEGDSGTFKSGQNRIGNQWVQRIVAYELLVRMKRLQQLQKIVQLLTEKLEVIIRPNKPPSQNISKIIKPASQTSICILMITAPLSSQLPENGSHLIVHEWTYNKIQRTYSEILLSLKEKKILMCTPTWMNHEDT